MHAHSLILMVLVKKESCLFSLAATGIFIGHVAKLHRIRQLSGCGGLLQSQFLAILGNRLRLLLLVGGWLFAIGFSRERERSDRHREFFE